MPRSKDRLPADTEGDSSDIPLTRANARLGHTLRDKWRLDTLLGVGGMAAVYAATHRNGSRAAVKVLHPELSVNSQLRGRFLREGYLANWVAHPGAVKVLDDDIADDGSLFLVTELLDGETLESRRVRFGGRLKEEEVLSIADQMLDVLAAAHAKGVVHRDLKPENIFLTRAGHIKVLDFGIARFRELSTSSSASTRDGSTLGTPAFMPPEQARGLWDEVDGRSDLWACGATMFYLLSGAFVHRGRTANELLLSAMTNPAPTLASAVRDVSPAVAHVVDRALSFDKANRWRDAVRMQDGIRHAFHDRHGAPIATAAKLTIPDTVPDRTLSSAGPPPGRALPTTGRPVATSTVPRRSALAAAAAMGAVAAAALVGTLFFVVAGRSGDVSTAKRTVSGDPATAESSIERESAEPSAQASVDEPSKAPIAAARTRPTATPPKEDAPSPLASNAPPDGLAEEPMAPSPPAGSAANAAVILKGSLAPRPAGPGRQNIVGVPAGPSDIEMHR